MRIRPAVLALMRFSAAILALAAVFGVAGAAAKPIELRIKPIPHFVIGAPDETRHDRLEFLGGLELSGPRGLGGLSGLVVEGERLTAVTDKGRWFTAQLTLDGERLVGLDKATLTRRMDFDGTRVSTKRRGDAEALTRRADQLLVAMESLGTILVYPFTGGMVPADAVPTLLQIPVGLARTSSRHGFEALATLPNGRVALFMEGRRRGETIPAALIPGERFAVKRHGSFRITGAAALPGGDLLLAERRYDGGLDVGFQIRRIGADALAKPAPVVDGPTLLRTDLRSEIDNMEAISAEVRDGNIILTVLSDNNFNIFQRTVLLRFRIADPLPRPHPRRAASSQPPAQPLPSN